jgi:cobalt/nickel transport system permease protein
VHIPDGFIAPQVYLPAYALAGGAWIRAGRDLRRELDETIVPRLAVLTALTYALGLVMLPLPGGTSGHAVGVGLLALLFGVRLAFVAYSLVLVLQSLLLGAGGITALPINALCIGLGGAAAAVLMRRALGGMGDTPAVAAAGAVSVLLPALLVALVLGLQPTIARRADGTPLFFPFGLDITLPAVLLPHLVIAAGEAVLTVLVWRYARRRGWPVA